MHKRQKMKRRKRKCVARGQSMHSREERVTLTMNREQARVVERACELLACLNVGQFNIITEMLMDSRRGMDDYCWRRDMAKEEKGLI